MKGPDTRGRPNVPARPTRLREEEGDAPPLEVARHLLQPGEGGVEGGT